MSGFATAASAFGFVKAELQGIVVPNTRAILWPINDPISGQASLDQFGSPNYDGLSSYVTLLEQGHDELQATVHPVEQGSVISDHAYKLPAHLTLRLVWSAAPTSPAMVLPFTGLLSALSFGDDGYYLSQLYNQLLDLQQTRTLVTIYTGKRVYVNMLPISIDLVTDERTENALMATVTFREILIVTTQAITVPINSSAQASPQETTPVTERGQQQLAPATSFNQSAAPAGVGSV